MKRAVTLVILALAVLAFACGCQREPSPQLISALDVVPREVEVGDRLEIVGEGFPQGKAARVAFRGTLRRPGERPEVGAVVNASGNAVTSQRIEIALTDALDGSFCTTAGHPIHTTFNGDVDVAFPAVVEGAPPIVATVHDVTIDLRPPQTDRALVVARTKEGERTLAFLGITVEPASLGAGLRVLDVAPRSRAENAGVHAGDLLVAFDGVRVASVSDVVPSGARKVVTVGLRASESAREVTKDIAIDGFKFALPVNMFGAAILVALAAAFILFFIAPTMAIVAWIERRVSAHMKARFTFTMRALFKDAAATGEPSERTLAPVFVFVAISALFVTLPFGQYLVAADLDIGILFTIAVTSFVTIGLITSGWSSHRDRSFLRGLKSAMRIISYEVPAAIAIVCIVMMTGSLRLREIIHAQGGLPWDWFLFKSPVTIALFFLYLTTAAVDGDRTPRDLPEADEAHRSEPAMRSLLFFFAEWANVFVVCAIAAALFLGGWQLPGVASGEQETELGWQLLGSLVFLVKAWALVFGVIAVRAALPRVRVDQMMSLSWRWFVPASIVALALTVGWIAWSPAQIVQRVVGIGMFAITCLAAIRFAQCVRYQAKAPSEAHINPFL